MVVVLTIATFLVLAVASDWITVLWHRRREAEDARGASLLSCVLEGLTWAPILGALAVGSGTEAWGIAGASVVGSGVGTWMAMTKWRSSRSQSQIVRSPHSKTRSGSMGAGSDTPD